MTDLRVRLSNTMLHRPSPYRWAGWLVLVAAAVLLPWMVVLGLSLPATESARHWALAWIGLDVMETTALGVTGWMVLRRDLRVRVAASAAGAFLLADAWFDLTTAQPTWDVVQAAALAFLVELPLVVLCGVLAVTAPHWCGVLDGSERTGSMPDARDDVTA